MEIDDIARVLHEANRALCTTVGDLTQPSWTNAEDWQREATTRGIEFVLAQPDAPASAQHDDWMAGKIAYGWTWGEQKDATAKTHPCIVPFDELPEHRQAKDALFRAVALALAPYLRDADARA